ncbi:hypothetical protein LWF01_02975 [Saxibacter everestensis]|uniref:Phage tail protein n=1 Tax=Saxibacter everestensis TaxID=2909229 RepID=A0ABY8QUP1_9MICO|nr:hypothetical protein LWF01_02975 [Brevibacteriaceae bacterium ZFBP1038]
MPTMAELKTAADSSNLVRKILESVIYVAPETAAPIDNILDAGGALIAKPADYKFVGMIGKDSGITFGSDMDSETVEAHGYNSPVRTDITGSEKTVQFTAIETNKTTLELHYGLDLSAVTAAATTGMVKFKEPNLENRPICRMLLLGVDGIGANQHIYGKFYPRVQVTEASETTWSASDSLAYELTFSAYPDPVLGYPVQHFLKFPAPALARSGFTSAP